MHCTLERSRSGGAHRLLTRELRLRPLALAPFSRSALAMDASTRLALPSLSHAESRTTPEPPTAQQLSDAGWRPGHGFALAPHEAGFDRQLGRHVEPADDGPSAGSADASDQSLPRCLAHCQVIATDAPCSRRSSVRSTASASTKRSFETARSRQGSDDEGEVSGGSDDEAHKRRRAESPLAGSTSTAPTSQFAPALGHFSSSPSRRRVEHLSLAGQMPPAIRPRLMRGAVSVSPPEEVTPPATRLAVRSFFDRPIPPLSSASPRASPSAAPRETAGQRFVRRGVEHEANMRPIRTAIEADLRQGAGGDGGEDRRRFGTLGLTRMRGPTRRLNERWMRHGEHDLPEHARSGVAPAPQSESSGSALRGTPLWARPLRAPTSSGDVEGLPSFMRQDEAGSSFMQRSSEDTSVEPPDFTEALERRAAAPSLAEAFMGGPYLSDQIDRARAEDPAGWHHMFDEHYLRHRRSIEELGAATSSPFEVFRARRGPVADNAEFAATAAFRRYDDAFAGPQLRGHMLARTLAFGHDEPELDGTDYDSLRALSSQMGDVVPRTTTADAIEAHAAAMPVVAAKEVAALATCSTADRCLICLDDYETDDRVRVLECRHALHVGWCAIVTIDATDPTSIDRWLLMGDKCVYDMSFALLTSPSSCPVCRSVAVPRAAVIATA